MERLQRKFNPVVVITGVVILILIITVIVILTHGTMRVGPNGAGIYNTTLSDNVHVGFPCNAHVTPSVHDNKGVTITSATCQTPASKAENSLLFTAVYEDYANDHAAQLADFNYCTSRSIQPGVGQDANTHITSTQKLRSDNKTYTTCVLTNAQGLAYEARAVTMSGSSNLLLQVDAPYPTNATDLQNDLHEFVGNASIQ